MERFKTFVREHETGLLFASSVVGALVVVVIHNKIVNGCMIKSADHFTRPDGTSVINAYLKNGQSIVLVKPTQS